MSFLEKYKSKNAPEKAAPKRMPKSKEWFAPITVSRFEKLNDLSGACWRLFTILFYKNIDSSGKPFALPDYTPDAFGGMSRSSIHRALLQLETCGLISIRRRQSKPPLITIL